MSNINEEHNNEALKAWNEWKEICFVAGCQPDYQKILRKEIYAAFDKKFKSICSDDYAEQIMTEAKFQAEGTRKKESDKDRQKENAEEKHLYSWEKGRQESDIISDDQNNDDNDDISEDQNSASKAKKAPDKQKNWNLLSGFWTTEFDHGIIAKAQAVPDADTPDDEDRQLNGDIWKGTAKNYKDHTWSALEKGEDPPLKVIRGLLIGPNGIINTIAEYYLWRNHRMMWENHQEYRRNSKRTVSKLEKIRSISELSLDQPVSAGRTDEDTRTLGDMILARSSWGQPAELKRENLKETEKELEEFTTWELALLLARAADLQTDKTTETFLKSGHTKISNYWNNTLRRKSLAIRDCFTKKTALFVMKKRIEAEDGGKLFLSKIREVFEEKGLGGLL